MTPSALALLTQLGFTDFGICPKRPANRLYLAEKTTLPILIQLPIDADVHTVNEAIFMAGWQAHARHVKDKRLEFENTFKNAEVLPEEVQAELAKRQKE